MFKVHLPWSQQGLKIEYLMTAELQQFQNFLSCTTAIVFLFFSRNTWTVNLSPAEPRGMKKKRENWNETLKPLLPREMNCVWIVKQTLKTVWNSLVKGQSHKVHRLSSLLAHMHRWSWGCSIVAIWMGHYTDATVLPHLFKSVSRTGDKDSTFNWSMTVWLEDGLPRSHTLKVSILSRRQHSTHTTAKHVDMTRSGTYGNW